MVFSHEKNVDEKTDTAVEGDQGGVHRGAALSEARQKGSPPDKPKFMV
jgi:hypothetical protein